MPVTMNPTAADVSQLEAPFIIHLLTKWYVTSSRLLPC